MALSDSRGKRLNKYLEDYVVFDLETTGINPVRDVILEISGLKVRGHKEVETFSKLVNPGFPIPPDAGRINGITDEMVAQEQSIRDILPDFLNFIDGEVLIGHNIQSFDLLFLNRAAEEICMKTVTNDYIDTLLMARSCLPQLSRYRLTDVAAHFHISAEGAHRALNDCRMNHLCYEGLGEVFAERDVPLCPKCGGELMKRNGKFGPFFGCSNYPDCRYTKNIPC